jgi:hypothetical protein
MDIDEKNFPNKDDNFIIEIYAELIYFVLVGKKKEIDNLANNINSSNYKDPNVQYISCKLSIPFALQQDEIEKAHGLSVKFGSCLETVQCHAYAEKPTKTAYILMCLIKSDDNSIELQYPVFDLMDNDDLELCLVSQLKKLAGIIPKSIEENMKPLALVGTDDNIVVYFSKVSTNNVVAKNKHKFDVLFNYVFGEEE